MYKSKPNNIDELILKLKGGAHSTTQINELCDEFILKLKDINVDIKDFTLNINIGSDVVSKSIKDFTDTDLDKIESVVVSEKDEEKENCLICMCELDEMSETLKCGHKFHHDCILYWFIEQNTDDACEGNKIPRCCPYCRSDGGYITHIDGEKFIEGIHKYPEKKIEKKVVDKPVNKVVSKLKKKVVTTDDITLVETPKTKVKSKVKKLKVMSNNKCTAITKKGIQCKKNKITGSSYCKLHS